MTIAIPASAGTGHALSDVDAAQGPARLFKALGDPVRLRILAVIKESQAGEICVCDLGCEFELSQPTISHHLKLLREAGLITGERRGTWSFYRLVPDRMREASLVLDALAAP